MTRNYTAIPTREALLGISLETAEEAADRRLGPNGPLLSGGALNRAFHALGGPLLDTDEFDEAADNLFT